MFDLHEEIAWFRFGFPVFSSKNNYCCKWKMLPLTQLPKIFIASAVDLVPLTCMLSLTIIYLWSYYRVLSRPLEIWGATSDFIKSYWWIWTFRRTMESWMGGSYTAYLTDWIPLWSKWCTVWKPWRNSHICLSQYSPSHYNSSLRWDA